MNEDLEGKGKKCVPLANMQAKDMTEVKINTFVN